MGRIDSYARESDYRRTHRGSVFGSREPKTLMVELMHALQSKIQLRQPGALSEIGGAT